MDATNTLVERAKWGKLSENNWPLIAQRLEAIGNGHIEESPWLLISLLGIARKVEYRTLIESFLKHPSFPEAADPAMRTLCDRWDLFEDYLDKIEFFAKDSCSLLHVRVTSVGLAGRFLRKRFHPELMKLLIHILENRQEDPSLRSYAGTSVALGLGKDWLELYGFRPEDSLMWDQEEHEMELASLIVDGRRKLEEEEKVHSSTNGLRYTLKKQQAPEDRKLDNLIEEATFGHITNNEIVYVINRLKNPKREEEDDLCQLLCILKQSDRWEYRKLIENFLYYPDWPFAMRTALITLCEHWRLTNDYLAEIKDFIRGKKGDFLIPVQVTAIRLAGEYLKETDNRDLLELLLAIMLDNTKAHTEREDAYSALSRAVGKKWDEIPAIDENWNDEIYQSTFLELAEAIRVLVQKTPSP